MFTVSCLYSRFRKYPELTRIMWNLIWLSQVRLELELRDCLNTYKLYVIIYDPENTVDRDYCLLDEITDLLMEITLWNSFIMKEFHPIDNKMAQVKPGSFDSYVIPASPLNQIRFFAPLRSACTRLRHHRMSWIVSKGRAAVHKLKLELLSKDTYAHNSKNQKQEYHKFHDFRFFEGRSNKDKKRLIWWPSYFLVWN